MRKALGLVTALALATAPLALSVVVAPPASACMGDPCDGVCVAYAQLPPSVQQKVFHSSSCPVR